MRTNRWRIIGALTTTAPLHIGSGEIVTFDHPSLKDGDGGLNDIQAVVRDFAGLPCIPGSALKGVLRSWAEQMLPNAQREVTRIFGERDVTKRNGESGWAEFCTARIERPEAEILEQRRRQVPFWNAEAFTGVLSHVSIDRDTGAAAHEKLFFEEFVPEGISFKVEIDATRLHRAEISLLLAILEQGSNHPTHPLHFGANGADGWGRMKWTLREVKACSRPEIRSDQVGFDCCDQDVRDLRPHTLTPVLPSHVSLKLALEVGGPFLVNDSSQTRPAECSEEERRRYTNFFPLRRPDGRVWLPASSLRGVLRERSEFILRSLNPAATGDPQQPASDGPIERLFGTTGQRARLSMEEPREATRSSLENRQDFVAIDRFTGGAAEGAKFDAAYADRPAFETELTLALEGLKPEDIALFRIAVQDICTGLSTIGWGGSKGYGDVTGLFEETGRAGGDPAWQLPDSLFDSRLDQSAATWIRDQLSRIYQPESVNATARPTAPAVSLQVLSGSLSVTQTKKGDWEYNLSYADAKNPNKSKSLKVHEAQIHPSLQKRASGGVGVEYEMENGKQVRIWPAGTPRRQFAQSHAGHAGQGAGFVHPYYFLRMEDRTKYEAQLRDEKPLGHRRWASGRFSGTIRVKLTVKTPLLVCDDQRRSESPLARDHFIYPVRTGADGKPQLASSSVRGMLRSAYEAITNSRFAVFPFDPEAPSLAKKANARKLGYRMNADDGLSLVPARIENGKAQLMMGETAGLPTFDRNRNRWIIPGALYAAWVPQYETNVAGYSRGAIRIGGQSPVHGQKAWCWLELMKHNHKPIQFWRVRQAGVNESDLDVREPPESRATNSYSSCGEFRKCEGYFVVSNQNIKNKHDERFFFGSGPPAEVDGKVLERYVDLIKDCQDLHKNELQSRNEHQPRQPPTLYTPSEGRRAEVAAMSRHTYEPAAASLDQGITLCYALVEKRGAQYVVKELYPVSISRKLFEKTPFDLLPRLLRPASSLDELSPADRVFGWVNQDKKMSQGETVSAYRSHLRVGPVTCVSDVEAAIDEFDEPKALAILGQPKPQQGRFYLGDKDGKAQPRGRSKADAGYNRENRIRGPKVYPHHKQAERYENADQWQESNPQAFSNEPPSNQNRSITGWVKPGATFSFDLHVTNLSSLELGALVWLLSLSEEHYLRLGLGKPLGFGSVRVEMDSDESRVADGAEWIGAIAGQGPAPTGIDLATSREAFEGAMSKANPELLAAFKVAAAGLGNAPVHYPLVAGQEPGSGETFKWFVANEKAEERKVLPDLLSNNPFLS